jgi:hypothetical protein
LAALLSAAACKQEEPAPKQRPAAAETATTAKASASPEADPELSKALEQAARAQAQAGGAATAGPPPNGILELERANQEAALGSLPKLTLATPGSEPRVSLSAPDLGTLADTRIGQMEVALRLNAGALPTLAFKFEVRPSAAAAGTEAVADAKKSIQVEVVNADLGQRQPGEIPPSVAERVPKFKGTRFYFDWQDGFALGNTRFERSKAAVDDLDLLLQTTSELFPTLLPALPKEPVGVGATWLVTSREQFLGTDVVAYRMVRVEEVGPSVGLSVTTKRYSTGGTLRLPGVPEHELARFEANDEAKLRVEPGHRLPVEGQIVQTLNAIFITDEGRAPVQFETRALLAFPPKPQAAPAASR